MVCFFYPRRERLIRTICNRILACEEAISTICRWVMNDEGNGSLPFSRANYRWTRLSARQLDSVSLIPKGASSGSEPFYRWVSSRLRLAGQLVRRQRRSLTKPPRKLLGLARRGDEPSSPSPFPSPFLTLLYTPALSLSLSLSSLSLLFFFSHCYEMKIG